MARPKKRETFSPVDAAWLRMDRPTNIMMITGIMMFDEPLDATRLRKTVEERFLHHRRFRQRVRESALGLPQWEDDPHFDVSAHVHRVALPAPGDIACLEEMVSDLMSTPLDPNKPLWHFHLIDNFNGGSALVGRLHHCIADGLALMDVLLSMADDAPDAAPVSTPQSSKAGRSILSRAIDGADLVLHETFQTLTRPSRALELARQGRELAANLAKQGGDWAAAAGKLLLTLPDQRTIFRGPCGVSKRAAWSLPFPLTDVKTIGYKLGGTVNDVLLSAVAGGLRRYLEERGEPTEGVEIRAMVPVSLRRPHEVGKMGNRFGLIILTLPVCVVDPLERLRIMKERMDDIKRSPEAAVAYGILGAMGQTPVEAERVIVDIFASKVTAIMTNVPGPKQSIYLAGSRLSGMMFWVPAAANLGMGISIISYAGHVTVGVATDTCTVPDPQSIVEGFHAELRDMRAWIKPEAVGATMIGAAEAKQAPLPLDGHCQAITVHGNPCRNRSVSGSLYCRVHTQGKAAYSTPVNSTNSA
jgi:diacylglycerol O-acyltransferase / wax synthase